MSGRTSILRGEMALDRCDGMRVVRLCEFEAPVGMAAGELESYRRRFLTLFLDESTARHGGLGCVTRVANAMGEVYALKTLLLPERVEGEDDEAYDARAALSRAAFRKEYEAHRALSGFKGFPRLYGYALADGVPAIVMEWVEGVTLAQARRELAVDEAGRMSPLDAARLGRDVFALLERLEFVGDGFVHRDISPSNIMLRTARLSVADQAAEGDFDTCLIDFGSSVPLDPAQDPHMTSARSAVRRATIAYAAPEMLSDDAPRVAELRRSPSLDVYAAASVLFEAVGASLPFEVDGGDGSSPYRSKMDQPPAPLVSAHGRDADIASVLAAEPEVAFAVSRALDGAAIDMDPSALQLALAQVDGQLADLIAACLAPAQEKRPDARAMRESLSAFCANYARNVDRALRGERLLPCTASESWNESTSPYAVNRVVDTVGRSCAYALLVGVTVLTSVLLDGLTGTVRLGPLYWEGVLRAPVLAMLLLAPAGMGLLARSASRRRGRDGALAGSLALGASALVVLALFSRLVVRGMEDTGALTSALFVTTAAGWLPLVLDYAMMVVPALVAELRRALPADAAAEPPTLDLGDARPTERLDSVERTMKIGEVCDAADDSE